VNAPGDALRISMRRVAATMRREGANPDAVRRDDHAAA